MKLLYVILGSISVGFGVLGIFLPLLPTTPFLLLAATLYFKGSPRLYGWLLGHRYLGTYIRNYREKKAVTLPAKIVSLSLLWISILFCIFFVADALWLKILLGVILIGVTGHIASFSTLRQEDVIRHVRARSEDAAALAALSPDTSAEAILTGMNSGDEYYFIIAGGHRVGCFCIGLCGSNTASVKIYILAEHRRKGYGSDALAYIENLCRMRKANTIALSLPHTDSGSALAFEKCGFSRSITPSLTDGIPLPETIMKKAV